MDRRLALSWLFFLGCAIALAACVLTVNNYGPHYEEAPEFVASPQPT